MKRGFVYLVAILDWATRKVLAHRVSISMTVDFCLEALEEAIAKYGRPQIFNTDQGSQFTSEAFTQTLRITTSRSAWMAEREVRARIPARLRQRGRGEATTGELLRFLQWPTPALVSGRNNTGHGILRQPESNERSMMLNHCAGLRAIYNRRNFT